MVIAIQVIKAYIATSIKLPLTDNSVYGNF